MNDNKKRGNRHPMRVALTIAVLATIGILFYLFVVEPFMIYESLELPSFRPYEFIANSNGYIEQVILVCGNNGTVDLTIDKVWVNDTFLNSSMWVPRIGTTLRPKDWGTFSLTPPTRLDKGCCYNITLGTLTGRHFAFMTIADAEHTETENLTLTTLDFNTNPFTGGYLNIDVRATNGPTITIVKKAYVNGTAFEQTEWIYPNEQTAINVEYGDWKAGNTYQVIIETAAGNTYSISGMPKH